MCLTEARNTALSLLLHSIWMCLEVSSASSLVLSNGLMKRSLLLRLPCSHFCVCHQCALTLRMTPGRNRCPLCRQEAGPGDPGTRGPGDPGGFFGRTGSLAAFVHRSVTCSVWTWRRKRRKRSQPLVCFGILYSQTSSCHSEPCCEGQGCRK